MNVNIPTQVAFKLFSSPRWHRLRLDRIRVSSEAYTLPSKSVAYLFFSNPIPMKPNTVTDIPSRKLKSTHTTALTIPQRGQPLRLGSINPTPRYETLRLCFGMLAQLAAEDVGHVFQGGGLVGGGDEEPDEDEGEGVEAGEDA